MGSPHDCRELQTIRSLGIPVLQLVRGGKVPTADMRDWPNRARPDTTVLPGHNYGVLCREVAAVDADSPELAAWWARNMPETPWTVKTPGGGRHFVYGSVEGLGNAQNVGRGWDVRAGGKGFVVGPGSRVRGRLYRLFGQITLDLPPFDPGWMPRRTPRVEAPAGRRRIVVIPTAGHGDAGRRIGRARAYAAKVLAVSGEGGHNATFRCVCRLRDFGLTKAEAWDELRRWNRTNAAPPWSEKELRHKLDDVFGK